MKTIAFFDLEYDPNKQRILDIGCVKSDGSTFHNGYPHTFFNFLKGTTDYLCGHNIINHDLVYLRKFKDHPILNKVLVIDTLFLSPLLFPSRPYHHLLKDEKLLVDELNNPVNDSLKARDLFYDEVSAFNKLDDNFKKILFNLLDNHTQFQGFFSFLEYSQKISLGELEDLIKRMFEGKICNYANLSYLLKEYPRALAYVLALINCNDRYSITPRWVSHTFPDIDRVMYLLRSKPCIEGCLYCDAALDPFKALKRYFGYTSFRLYAGQPLQEEAVKAAVSQKSLLAVFPTGGGKSITFQLPALMEGENLRALTIIISPLQSLMKDQVDNLEKHGITDAVTINGLLDPIERSKAIERIREGSANLLYISPESLRSVTIQKLLLGRKIARFVIDEAHCFSSWGQDFRVDYLYIGDFIKTLQDKKGTNAKIPISCFTATAKQKVIEDIRSYFKDKLDLELELFASNASRTNLHYKVYNKADEEQKYTELRRILETKNCPTIIYVSRTKKAFKLAERLTADGITAKSYHGKMDKEQKIQNQNDFIEGQFDIMVATSAFGMGVDKKNVGMVIHYDISDSLENYIQEAGRAGRDESITADCYILFNEEDLDKHFLLLNQTKLDIKEINQIWKAIKELSRTRDRVTNSALEIARKAGWDDTVSEIETRVTTAIAALEDAGYLKRGQNSPRVFANSILSKNAQEAIENINRSTRFNDKQKVEAIRIIKKMFSSKSKRLSTEENAETRIDYISDNLGILKGEVIRIVQLLREEKILADAFDLTAFIKKGENSNKSLIVVEKYKELEEFLLSFLSEEQHLYNLKELNERAAEAGCKDVSPNKIKTILNIWAIKNWIKKSYPEYSRNYIDIILTDRKEILKERLAKRHLLANLVIKYLYKRATNSYSKSEEVLIEFSELELIDEVKRVSGLFQLQPNVNDIEDCLFYLSRIEAIKIEGGFLVVYNALTINRIEKNNKIQYKQDDYRKLKQFYENKVQQIHIVGEYAKRMVQNYDQALRFVDDYFRLNYSSFLNKYFTQNQQEDITRTITPAKFRQLFGELSPAQLAIVNAGTKEDKDKTKQILVAAGPGSGKTRVLVHKLASLLLLEDVKHEQLLMLTFSRAAATEFKKRLIDLIGKAANFVEIKTFHSYAFDLLGKVGNLNVADSVLSKAIEKIRNGDIERNKITKTVLVIDEAQDMNPEEFELIKTLMDVNEELRVILVGDDDQNIYEFRGSDSNYMKALISSEEGKIFELVENYRSSSNLVDATNQWSRRIAGRLKTTPIIPVKQEKGSISITEHSNNNLVVPLVRSVQNSELSGSTCVLTKTNDEAVQVTGMLLKQGVTAKLIQTNDGFNLYDLQELRYFTNLIEENSETPVIDDECWQTSFRKLCEQYKVSSKLEWCKTVICDFEKVNPNKKYKTDWRNFLQESKFEDFIRISSDVIYVSTIHKAKGKEFENVFLLLNNFDISSNEGKKQIYVALTRAKSNLYIHYNGHYFNDIIVDKLIYTRDNYYYESPAKLSYHLTHKDVWLGFFDGVQGELSSVNSGYTLLVNENGLADSNGKTILRFSKKFKENIEQLIKKGYAISSAKANYLVYWTNSETGKEIKIVLPELQFEKNDTTASIITPGF